MVGQIHWPAYLAAVQASAILSRRTQSMNSVYIYNKLRVGGA